MNVFKSLNSAVVSVFSFLVITVFFVSFANAQASVTFDRMWIDYNIKQEEQSGMLLHTKFTVKGLKSVDCQLRVKFNYDVDEDKPVKDTNQKFYTTDGNVAVFRDIKPGYDPSAYEDFQVFMPYNELDLPFGEYTLKMDVDLIYKNGELIQHLTWYPFAYSKKVPAPATTTDSPADPAASTPTATFDSMWVDYDITEGERLGMRIHIKYTVAKMKGTKGYVVFFIEKPDGTRLKSYDNKFQSKGNDVAVYKSVAPGFDPAAYADYTAFIPYEEFHLPAGDHTLKIDADLIYEDGKLIQHLGFKDFQYKKTVQ